MGYSHYWSRSEKLNREKFAKASREIKRLAEKISEDGVVIAGPEGVGKPEFSDVTIAFNGAIECGHPYRNIGEAYPAKESEGIASDEDDPVDYEAGAAFSGAYLKARACNANCKAGPFLVDRDWMRAPWHQKIGGMYEQRCETNYKPYDLLVTAALIRLKENLDEEIVISSDGDEKAFTDAKRICRDLFGWPNKFELKAKQRPVLTTTDD